MDSTITARLETLLRQIQLALPSSDSSSLSADQENLFTSLCRLVFDKRVYQWLWDESILRQLDWLFRIKPPAPRVFGEQVAELRQHAQQAQRVNDFFFAALNSGALVEEVEKTLAVLTQIDPSLLFRLNISDRLRDLRKTNDPLSEKITAPSMFPRQLSQKLDLALSRNITWREVLDSSRTTQTVPIPFSTLAVSKNECHRNPVLG